MATVTAVSGHYFANLGPLPTTWSNPESCTASTTSVGLALDNAPAAVYWRESCDFESQYTIDCFPSLEAVNDAWDQVTASDPNGVPIPYFSPGVACPAGWTTVGVAARNEDDDEDDEDLSSSGIYAPWSTGSGDAPDSPPSYDNPHGNVFMNALEAGETMVACCPSGFSADPEGPCYKELDRGAYTADTGCQVVLADGSGADIWHTTDATYTLYGEVVTGLVTTMTGDPTYSTMTVTLDGGDVEAPADIVAATYFEMITVVYQESDMMAATLSSSSAASESAAGAETETAEESEESSNAAGAGAGGRTRGPGGGSVVGVALAWTAALLLGVAVAPAMPWR